MLFLQIPLLWNLPLYLCVTRATKSTLYNTENNTRYILNTKNIFPWNLYDNDIHVQYIPRNLQLTFVLFCFVLDVLSASSGFRIYVYSY